MNNEIKSMLGEHAILAVENKMLDQVQKTITTPIQSIDVTAAVVSETLPLKHNKVGKAILELLQKAFDEKKRQYLGITIRVSPDHWFSTGFIEFMVSTSSEIKSVNTQHQLPRTIQTDAAQYLTEKDQRRSDTSFLAVRYKSIIAKLIQQMVNAMYHRRMSNPDLISYLECLDNWISLIRQEKLLFNGEKNHDAKEQHFESFLLEIQRKIILEIDTLRLRTDAHQVHKWLSDWQDELGILLRSSIIWWHTAIHTQLIPKNLYEQLDKLGTAYQRHLEQQAIGSTENRIPMSPERLKFWQQQKAMTIKKLQQQYSCSDITNDLVKQAAQEQVISWTHYYFFNLDDGYYTAEQMLWELLYYPKELPLSSTTIKDELCYDKILECYRTGDEASKQYWFLCLLADIQHAHAFTPRLIELSEQKESLQTSSLIKSLSTTIKSSAQADWLHTIPYAWRPGILTEIDSLVSTPCTQTIRAMTLLRNIKRYQAQFAHLWGSLELYRKILPSTGEIIGALALGQHLQSAVQLVNQCGGEFEKDCLELNQLLRFGKEQPGLQTLVLQHKVAWYERTKSKAINSWLGCEKERQQQGIILCESLRKCINLANKLNEHCSPAVLVQRATSAEKLFLIADDVSTPFLKEVDETGKVIMKEYQSLVSSSLTMADEKKSILKPKSSTSIPSTVKPSIALPNTESNCVLSSLQIGMQTITKYLNDTSKPVDLKTIHRLLEDQQESFFVALSVQYSGHLEACSLWLQQQSGFTGSPLPALQPPVRFLWWYRHTRLDRALLFRSLCLSLFMNEIKQNGLTSQSHQQLQQLIILEHADAELQYRSHSSWFDGWHCRIRAKHKAWRNKVQSFLTTLPAISDLKSETKLILPVITESDSTVTLKPQLKTETDTTSSIDVITTEEKQIISIPSLSPVTSDVVLKDEKTSAQSLITKPSPCTIPNKPPTHTSKVETPSSAASLLMMPSLLLSRESPEWKPYHLQLMTSSTANKRDTCLTFLLTTLVYIEAGTLVLSDPRHTQQFHHAMALFWEAIQMTKLAETTLGVLLNFYQAQSATQTSYSARQQHRFMTSSVREIMRNKSSLLSNTTLNWRQYL